MLQQHTTVATGRAMVTTSVYLAIDGATQQRLFKNGYVTTGNSKRSLTNGSTIVGKNGFTRYEEVKAADTTTNKRTTGTM